MKTLRYLPRVVSLSLLSPAALLLLGPARLCGQNTSAKTADTSSASGFSIESEMLTYRALESNSDATACEVTSVLDGVPIGWTKKAPGGYCNTTNNKPQLKIVILPFDNHIVSDFALWRADMQTMRQMVARGIAQIKDPKTACSGNSQTQETPASNQSNSKGATSGGIVDPFSAQIGEASSILALFASDASISPVGGTINDQALMDNVSRDLRVLHVNVLSPSLYLPTTLAPIDETTSPFLARYDQLHHVYDCLVKTKGPADSSVTEIKAFLDGLNSSLPSSSGQQKQATNPAATGANPAPAANTGTTATSQPESHWNADLAGDGLAHSLGVGLEGNLAVPQDVHLLLLKALESGGEVIRLTNILGTHISYSGGSVVTYALFNLDGQMECSGNLYDFTGPVRSRNFNGRLRAADPDPSAQVIFKRGFCPAYTAISH
jgi:hypothetical protein